MWIISYGYEDASGKHYSQCKALKECTGYSIGRSVNCELRIQHDKSISRVHLVVKYEKNELSITNKGKLTKVNNKPVRIDECIVIQNHDIVFDIGGSPINVEIHFSYQEWKIPHKLSLEEEKSTILQYGVKLCESFSKKSTLQVFSEGSSHTGCLFALIKGIPVVSTEFLNCVCQLLKEDNYLNFEPSFQAIIRRFNLFPSYNHVPNVLSNICIIVFEQKLFDTLRYTIESGGGMIKLLTSTSEINGSVIDNEKKIIVLSTNTVTDTQASKMSTSFSNKFSESGIVTHSLNDFVNALINNDLNALSERKQPITEEPTKEIAQPVAVKSKARIKPKVQRLDSLTCFGGGNQLKIENSEYSTPSKTSDDSWKKGSEHESKSTNSSEAVEPTPFVSKSSEIVTPPTDTKENISSITTAFAKENEPSIALDSKKRKRRPKVQQLGNLMMRDIPKVATENFQEQRDGDLKRIKLETDTSTEKSILAKSLPRNDKEDSNLIKYKYDSTKLGKENDATNNGYKQKDDLDDVKKGVISDESTPQDQPSSFEKSEKSSQRVTDRPRSIAKLETNLPERRKTNDIVSAIAETKQKEVRRFQEGIFEVDQSELTESSLEEFKNVAKVEKTKVKPRVLHPTVVSDKSAIWAGRKNFKRFTKKWPSYMKSCSIETNTGHIPYPKDNNNNNNNNRYIAMKRFDYRKDGKSEENNGINIEVDFRLPNRMEGSNELSLQQSGETESAQESRIASGFGFKSKPISVPERNTLFITEDDDDSYDDDAPAVHGNKTGREDDISLQSNRSVSFGTNSLERSNSADADTDDDDDDENDTRRFNFRSRRRK